MSATIYCPKCQYRRWRGIKSQMEPVGAGMVRWEVKTAGRTVIVELTASDAVLYGRRLIEIAQSVMAWDGSRDAATTIIDDQTEARG